MGQIPTRTSTSTLDPHVCMPVHICGIITYTLIVTIVPPTCPKMRLSKACICGALWICCLLLVAIRPLQSR